MPLKYYQADEKKLREYINYIRELSLKLEERLEKHFIKDMRSIYLAREISGRLKDCNSQYFEHDK